MKSHALFHRPILVLAAALVAAIIVIPSLSVRADTVKMKDGKVHEGKITIEANDFIKLEVQVSATIKNTMTIPRADIAEIVKAAPDDVALNDLRKQLPAPSLMTPEAYRTMIEKGPKAFLTQFPGSRHKPEVEKMLADLSAELDKVERGGVKIDGEWISAQDRKQFQALTDSRIRLVAFRRNAAQRNYIAAMRDFEILEEQFYGTPAFATAVGEAKQLLPAFGALVQQSLDSVKVRNEQWERDKSVLDEVSRAQVEAARAQELANFKLANDREKAAGVKWMTINNNAAESLNGALTLVKAELDRLGKLNVANLTQLGEQLVAADKLIAEGKLAEARDAIAKALAADAEAAKAAGAKGGSTKSSKSSKAGSKPGSYIAALNLKIGEAEAAAKLAAEQAATAAAGAQAASTVAGSQPAVAMASPGEAAPVAAPGEEAAKDGAAAAPKAGGGLADLMATGGKAEPEKGKEDAAESKSGSKKSSSSSKKKAPASEDDEDPAAGVDFGADDAEPVDDGEGGGLSFTLIMQIVAGVMVLILVVLKVAGIGGKKKEE